MGEARTRRILQRLHFLSHLRSALPKVNDDDPDGNGVVNGTNGTNGTNGYHHAEAWMSCSAALLDAGAEWWVDP